MPFIVSLMLILMSSAVMAEDSLDVLNRDYAGGTSQQSSSLRGQLRPVNFTVLSAGIDGKLIHFPVRSGSRLKKGELIARFFCTHLETELEIATAKAAAAQKNLEVNVKLDAYENISELELAMSEAEAAIAIAEHKRAATLVKDCEIYAPYNAIVTEKLVQAHQYVKQGEQLIEIVGTDDLEIEMVLPSIDVLQFQKGRPFSLRVDETGRRYNAEIGRVVSVVDPVSQTIRVIGLISGEQEGLMPGMSGVIEFE